MECSTCPQTHARFEKLIDELSEPTQRAMLRVWLDHWWGEVQYDIDAVMATVTADVSYKVYGLAGSPVEFSSAEKARTMYLSQFEAGLMPGCVFDAERVAFGSWGLAFDCIATLALDGASIASQEASIIADELYLVQLPLAAFCPFDRSSGLMAGEHVYMGSPRAVERTDRTTIQRLLGHG